MQRELLGEQRICKGSLSTKYVLFFFPPVQGGLSLALPSGNICLVNVLPVN